MKKSLYFIFHISVVSFIPKAPQKRCSFLLTWNHPSGWNVSCQDYCLASQIIPNFVETTCSSPASCPILTVPQKCWGQTNILLNTNPDKQQTNVPVGGSLVCVNVYVSKSLPPPGWLVHKRQPEWPLYSLCLCVCMYVCLSVQSTTSWDVIRFGWNLNIMLISMPSFFFPAMGVPRPLWAEPRPLVIFFSYFFSIFYRNSRSRKFAHWPYVQHIKKFSLIRSILREKIGFEEMGGDR